MKKTFVAVIAIAAILAVSVAAVVAYAQYLPSPAQSGSGQLAVMGTDPVASAYGVSDSTIHYSSVSAHNAGSDMSSGWIQVSGSGTLDLMTSGSAQTLAIAKVNSGTYDAFRLNVDSCNVVYQGQQYLATVASTTVTAQSQSRVVVNSTSTAAAVVDLRTFIMNTGNASKPQFIFSATAKATNVPPSALVSVSLQLGTSVSLSGSWWTDFQAKSSTNVVLQTTLTSGSMVLKAQNTGNADAEIQEVIVTPASASVYATGTLPSSFAGSAVFTADSSGNLQPSNSLQATALLNGGATLAAGSSTTMTFNGNISLSFDLGGIHVSGVVAGQQYIITVIGANTYASTVVVAS